MTLDEDQVAGMLLRRRAPEVIEAHFVERRRGGVAREMPAVLGGHAVRLQHHRQRIPADVGLDAPLERAVARIIRLDRKSTRLNSSHVAISYAVFCLKKKK